MIGTPELADDCSVIVTYANSYASEHLPVIDIEAILEILFTSIDDIAMGSTSAQGVVEWLVNETIDFKEPLNEAGWAFIAMLTQFYNRILHEVHGLGMLQNGRFHYAYKAILPDGTFLLQRAILDT